MQNLQEDENHKSGISTLMQNNLQQTIISTQDFERRQQEDNSVDNITMRTLIIVEHLL